jgi:predicted PurR-regulated permease PerM
VLTSDRLAIHPLPSFLVTIVGASVAGFVGAVLATPVLAATIAVVRRLPAARIESTGSTPAPAHATVSDATQAEPSDAARDGGVGRRLGDHRTRVTLLHSAVGYGAVVVIADGAVPMGLLQGVVMLAYEYPLLGLFWTILMVFIWVAWLMLLFRVFIDIFRDPDNGGWAKALWSIFVLIVPFLGVFVYLIARGDGMTKRDMDQARQNEAAIQDYIRSTAGSGGGTADELTKLAELHSKGVLSDAEFQQQKAKLLA